MTTVTHLVINDIAHDPRVTKEIHSALDDGYAVNCICMNPTNHTIERVIIKDIRINQIEKYKIQRNAPIVETSNTKLTTKKDLLRLARIALYNIQIVRKGLKIDSDIIHANDLNTLLAGYILSRIKKAKLFYDSHEIYPEQFEDESKFFKLVLYTLEKILLTKVDRIITVNESIAEWFVNKYKVPTPVVVLNSIESKNIVKKSKKSTGRIKGIYLGMMGTNRGLEELLQASKFFHNTEIYFQGNGALEQTLKRIVIREGLTNIIFRESVPMESMVQSIQEFDFGVIPYKPSSINNYYCTPNKLFEYMSAGLAVLASDIPEMRRFVGEKGNGLLFNPNDPKDIADKINLLTHKDLENMKKKCLVTAREYCWEKQAKKLLDAYKEAVI